MLLLALALSAVQSAQPRGPIAPPDSPGGSPRGFQWGDYDADGFADALALLPGGEARLLRNLGDGTLEDVTALVGLPDGLAAQLALWGDYDADGALDLYLGSLDGESRLFRQTAGTFQDVTERLGLEPAVAPSAARWIDYDGDGTADLHLSTAGGEVLYHGLGGTAFERVELGLPGPAGAGATAAANSGRNPASAGSARVAGARSVGGSATDVGPRQAAGSPQAAGGSADLVVSDATPGPSGTAATGTGICVDGLFDQAGGGCMNASSTPTLGMLFSMSPELNVHAATGNVGIGTVAPGYTLEVAGQIVSGSGNAAPGVESAIGGGELNTASGDQSVVAGGESNLAAGLQSSIGGGYSNYAAGDRAAIAGGVGNGASYRAFVGGGDNNDADGNFSAVVGGLQNDAFGSYSTIAGGRENVASADYAAVAGGWGNQATGFGAFAGAGDYNVASGYGSFVGTGASNQATGERSAILSGADNVAEGIRSFVGTGQVNRALGDMSGVVSGTDNHATGYADFVGGGQLNVASGGESGIAAGSNNRTLGAAAFVGGGTGNHASGTWSGVLSGYGNVAAGEASMAGGWFGEANHDRTFVWSTRDTVFASTQPRTFLIDAENGVAIGRNTPLATLTVEEDAAQDPLRVRVGGATRMIVKNDGGVGIGTLAPTVKLHVDGGSDVSPATGGYLVVGSTFGQNIALDGNEIMARNNGSTATLSLNADGGDIDLVPNGPGEVAIGASSSAAKLDIHAEAGLDALRVRVNGTTRLLVDDGGRVVVGANTTPSFDLQVASGAPNGGTAAKPGGGSWSNSSDRRLKKNVADLEGALDTLLALRGVTYEYKDPRAINELEGTRIGFIAQEVEEVVPDWVDEKPDGMKMLTIRGFEALAVEALRTLREEKDAEIARLAQRVEALEAELARRDATALALDRRVAEVEDLLRAALER